MEPFNIELILPIAAGVLFIIQVIYLWGVYNGIHRHNQSVNASALSSENPPLSVIIVAKNAAGELQKNLPFILEQDYPAFEVIVVHDRLSEDSDDALKLFENKYPHLYHTFIPDSARHISRKKLGITMGIKAARHEWLVFTETNCRPLSNQWLKQMARNFTPDTEIVLGCSNYEKTRGLFNKKIIFDTLLNSMRFLGMALAGRPYAGTGHNLAYRKALYYKQKGFTSHLRLQRGEDDLFINGAARAHNTRVETSADSLITISAPAYQRTWCEEKLNYMVTSRLYKGIGRYAAGFETCSRLLFYAATVAAIVVGILMQQWAMWGTALLLWLLRYAVQIVVFRRASRDLQTRCFYALLPLFDLWQPLWNGRFKLQQRLRRKGEFMRR